MKYIPLVLAGLWRKPSRTIFTFLSVVVAFILFGVMASIEASFAHQIEISRLDRLYADPRSPGAMPQSYRGRIAALPGVRSVTPVANLNGYWKDRPNGFGVVMTDESYLLARPEYTITRALMQQVDKSRTGILVSRAYATRYNWKVGDRIPLTSPIAQQDGGKAWNLDILAIVDNRDMPGDAMFALGSYRYFDEARSTDRGTVNRYIVRIADLNQSASVSRAIDDLFANSPKPTRTTSERLQSLSGANAIGDITFFTRSIIGAVLFMLLFLTGNSMMQSMRERIPEFAVLKTLGFSDTGVLMLVFAEALVLCAMAGLTGLAIVKLVGPALRNTLPGNVGVLLQMPWSAAALGLAVALLMALAAGFIPALRAQRLNVVDALAGR